MNDVAEAMSVDDLTALLNAVEFTAPVVATNYPKIVDEDGESLLRECQWVNSLSVISMYYTLVQ